MFSCILRFLLVVIICLTIAQAYPPSMSKVKWLPARVARPYLIHEGPNYDHYNLPNENDAVQDLNDSNGFATWLFRSRKFCCAPPL